MEDKYINTLKTLERRMDDSVVFYSVSLMESLDDIALSMLQEDMTDNDYLKLLQLYAIKYKKLNNVKGRRFCLLRMQQLLMYRRYAKKQREFPRIDFGNPLDDDTKSFLREYPSYYTQYIVNFKKKVLKMDIAFFAVLMVFFVLLLKTSFVAGWIVSLIAFIGILIFAFTTGFQRIMEDRFDDLLKKVDDNLEAVDRSVRNILS